MRIELLRECIHCEADFNINSSAKKQAGGKINECPDCVEDLQLETTVKYFGHSSGESDLNIVSFDSAEARASYTKARSDDKVKL